MNSYTYNEIVCGQEETFCVEITDEMVKAFGAITGDQNPLHTDADYAKSKNYKDKVVYGLLTASFTSTLAGMFLPGKYSLIHEVEAKFPKPVYVGDTITIRGTVTEKDDKFQLLTLRVDIRNAKGDKVCRGQMKVSVRDGDK